MSEANVQYPHEYQRFLKGVKLLDFDLGWMISASSVIDIDFHDRLLFATIVLHRDARNDVLHRDA